MVLFGLATLEGIGVFSEPRIVLGLIFWASTWLVGLAAVWLLWRPESSAFFKPAGAVLHARGVSRGPLGPRATCKCTHSPASKS